MEMIPVETRHGRTAEKKAFEPNLALRQSRWLDLSKFNSAKGTRFPFSVSILSWGLNEEENIAEFLGRAQKFMDGLQLDYEHILIDDGSTDKTYEIALGIQKSYPQLRIIRNEKNKGSGWNTRIAVAAAKNDILFWQMVDWSYDISKIGRYLTYFRDFDVVQGVRIRDTEPDYGQFLKLVPFLSEIRVSKRSDNFKKAVISVVNYLLIRVLFRIPVLDFQNVTLYPRRLAQEIDFESHSAFTNPEMLLKAFWKGAAIKQVSIGFIARQKGVAKGTRLKVVLASIRQVIGYWFKWVVLGRRRDKLRGTVDPVVTL